VRPALSARHSRGAGVATVAVAAAAYWLAWENGGAGTTTTTCAAIVVWAAVAAAALAGVPARPRGVVVAAGGALGVYVAELFASAWWAPSAEGAVADFDRGALYLGLFALAALAVPRASVAAVLDGLALGLGAIVVTAFASRCFPHAFPRRDLLAVLPAAAPRLSFPIGYWNGLAALTAVAVPLLLRTAVRRTAPAAGLSVAALSVAGSVLYLTSSRGGVLAAALGAGVFLAAGEERLHAAGALVAAAAGAIVAAWYASREAALDAGLANAAAVHEGRRVAAVALVAALAGAAAFLVARPRLASARLPRRLTAAAALAGAACIVAVLAAAHPVRLVERFKALPPAGAHGQQIGAHLLAGSGSGRWQFWSASLAEFRAHPIVGGGASSTESWWNRHGSFYYVIHDAHSLYVESLGELGILGGAAIAAFVIVVLVSAARRAAALPRRPRLAIAACLASFAAWAFAAGIDWIWELPGATAPVMVAAGLAVGVPARTSERVSLRSAAAVAVVALAVGAGELLPLLGDLRLRDSRDAAASGHLAAALADARSARSVEPWAASPYVQSGLVEELRGRFPAALAALAQAAARDRGSWQIWYVRARVEREAGNARAAAASMRRARALDPRSPLLRDAAPIG